MTEQVMVVRTEALRPLLRQGIIDDDSQSILEIIREQHTFIDRPTAEVSEDFRQVIPYVVIRFAADPQPATYFVLTRTPKQTEARLHHKRSLGIGGHINPDYDVMSGLKKELDEEVQIADAYTLTFAGILNDESTEVGRVHLGAVFLLEASSRDVTVLETEKMSGEWVARNALAPLRESMESWSQIVHDALIA
jgi:predicted NUDIX family phosphoesterase